MNKRQSNYLAMTTAVHKVFNRNQTEINNLPALVNVVTSFNKNILEMHQVLQVQQGVITGSAAQKQKEETEMIDKTVQIAASCYVFAIDTSNFDLMEQVNISNNALRDMPQAALLSVCTNVLNIARQHSDELCDYGITPDEVKVLDKEILDFAELVGNPRSAIITRSQATRRLGELIAEQRVLLNQKADKLMLLFKERNPVFYNEYKAARIIVNMGTRHKAEEEEVHEIN